MTQNEIIALCEKLDKTLGYPMFQFDEKCINGNWKPIMDEVVECFLSVNNLTGWIPYKLSGNATNMGEQIFSHPEIPNIFISFSAYETDDMEIDAYAIYEGHRRNNELYFYQLAYKYV